VIIKSYSDKIIILIIYILFSSFSAIPENIEISVILNEKLISNTSIVFAKVNDSLILFTSNNQNWFSYKPVLKEYKNCKDGIQKLEKIRYHKEFICESNQIKVNTSKPGTYYIGISSNFDTISIETYLPLYLINKNIIQIVIRENDSYVGYVTELLGLPFILPPFIIEGVGHQTDLRVGADCAELAIYGMRRMGFNIPYCGPKGIIKYLLPTNKIIKGTIVHFGFQVTILYEDKGIKGKLDDEDLIIHAFEDCVKIEPFGKTKLKKKKYKLYYWKILKDNQ